MILRLDGVIPFRVRMKPADVVEDGFVAVQRHALPVLANFRHPDVGPAENVRFWDHKGGVAASGAALWWSGVAGKASPMSGDGRTVKRSRRRVPGKVVAV